MIMVHVQVFFYECILDPKWIFVIHYDPRLRRVFDYVFMNIQENNDIQPSLDERLENNEEMTTHGDVQDEDFQAQHETFFHAINQHVPELDDP